jgi:hypothetical protein
VLQAPVRYQESYMPPTRLSQPKPPLQDLPAQEALRLRDEAPAAQSGVARDAMVRKARLVETASHINDWLASPGLQAPR